MAEKVALVGIVMGSSSDIPKVDPAFDVLDDLGIIYECRILSAHRANEEAVSYARLAEKRCLKVIICAAGLAAHLAGVIAANTIIPVVGIPIDSGPLNGVDALLSTVQMPPGIPVATMAIGKAGSKNSAILAAQILALNDEKLAWDLREMRKKMAEEVTGKQQNILNDHMQSRKIGGKE